MGKMPNAWTISSGLERQLPAELEPIVEWFDKEADARERFRWALRDSLNELLDGQRTGRWAYQHLSKTEKTHLGTVVEVNLTKEFEFANGVDLDWQIAGRDIDCKFSKDWAAGKSRWRCTCAPTTASARARPITGTPHVVRRHHEPVGGRAHHRHRRATALEGGNLERAYNRDNKRCLANTSAGSVYWLWGGLQTDLPRNLLLHLNPDARGRILSPKLSGQKRVDQLFREAQGQIVGRETVLTVAQQDDAPKRARDARIPLREEGIVIIGHQGAHKTIAEELDLPVPVKGEWLAVRIIPVSETDSRPFVTMHGERWARAHDDEPVVAVPAD